MGEIMNWNEPVAGYSQVRVRHALSNEVEPALANLDAAVSKLPKVDANGYSECPYAAQFYRQKDEAAAKVAKVLKDVRNKLQIVEQEVDRCLKRLEYLQSHEKEIHDPRVQDGYGSAASDVQWELACASDTRRMLKEAIERMERALTHAAKLTYPGSYRLPAPEEASREEDRSSIAHKPYAFPTPRGIITPDADR
jgi:DNA repair ATPase RecN